MCPDWMLPCETQRIWESSDQRLQELTTVVKSEFWTKLLGFHMPGSATAT
jgi:hypothetical protein